MKYTNEMLRGAFTCKCAIMHEETFMNHCHSELEVIKVCQGTQKITIENEELTLFAGDIWVIPPFINHSIAGGSDDRMRIAMLIEPGLLGIWDGKNRIFLDVDMILEHIDGDSSHWEKDIRDEMNEIIENIYEEYTSRKELWQLSIKTQMDRFLVLAKRRLPKKTQTGTINRQMAKLKAILSYIALNYCEELSLEACAKEVGFNPTYLSRYFKKYMNITYQDYIKNLRLDKAKWLLRTEGFSITEICSECGFHDIRTFNKLFKKETGLSPTSFRKNYRM